MINFLNNFILDFFYGKRLGIDTQRVKKYRMVVTAFKALAADPSMPATIVTGDTFDRVMRDLPYRFHFMQENFSHVRHLVIPAIAYQFFLSGGTWKEIDEYNMVLEYGMLHNQKRRI